VIFAAWLAVGTCQDTSRPRDPDLSERPRLRSDDSSALNNHLIDGPGSTFRICPSIRGRKWGYAERDCWTCRRQRFSVDRETASVRAASSTDIRASLSDFARPRRLLDREGGTVYVAEQV
jgi:hypothetical protein